MSILPVLYLHLGNVGTRAITARAHRNHAAKRKHQLSSPCTTQLISASDTKPPPSEAASNGDGGRGGGSELEGVRASSEARLTQSFIYIFCLVSKQWPHRVKSPLGLNLQGLWHFIPPISFVEIVCASPLLTAK